MASKNRQLVAFEVAMELPPGVSLEEATAFIKTSLLQGAQSRPAADPMGSVKSESFRLKLTKRTVIYGG